MASKFKETPTNITETFQKLLDHVKLQFNKVLDLKFHLRFVRSRAQTKQGWYEIQSQSQKVLCVMKCQTHYIPPTLLGTTSNKYKNIIAVSSEWSGVVECEGAQTTTNEISLTKGCSRENRIQSSRSLLYLAIPTENK